MIDYITMLSRMQLFIDVSLLRINIISWIKVGPLPCVNILYIYKNDQKPTQRK